MGLDKHDAIEMAVIIILLMLALLIAAPAHAQFVGYVGLQTTYTRILNNSTTTGRTVVQANIGASYHTFTFCLTPTSGGANLPLAVFVEESPDGNANHFVQISPTTAFAKQSINGNSCNIIRVGGYYSVLALNVAQLQNQSISAWYTATAGPTDVFPPGVNSNGGTSPVQCDRSAILENLAPGATYQIINGFSAANPYVCGGTISFSGATTSGTIIFFVGPGTTCGGPPAGALNEIYEVDITPASPQLFQINAAPNTTLGLIPIPVAPSSGRVTPGPTAGGGIGNSVCVQIGAIGANTTLTVSFAQF